MPFGQERHSTVLFAKRTVLSLLWPRLFSDSGLTLPLTSLFGRRLEETRQIITFRCVVKGISRGVSPADMVDGKALCVPFNRLRHTRSEAQKIVSLFVFLKATSAFIRDCHFYQTQHHADLPVVFSEVLFILKPNLLLGSPRVISTVMTTSILPTSGVT